MIFCKSNLALLLSLIAMNENACLSKASGSLLPCGNFLLLLRTPGLPLHTSFPDNKTLQSKIAHYQNTLFGEIASETL